MNQTLIAEENGIAQALLEEFEREYVTTRKFLERLPNDKLSWRPHPKSMSAGELGLHIAETPGGALRMGLLDRASPPDTTRRAEATSVAELLSLIDDSAVFVRGTLSTVTDAKMQGTFALDLPDGSTFELPRSRFIRSVMLNHWYHHRGQFGVYLRLLGVSVPSSYGPSGDELGGI